MDKVFLVCYGVSKYHSTYHLVVSSRQLERQSGSNKVPSFDEVLAHLKTTDGWADMIKSDIANESGWEGQFAEEQKRRYDKTLLEMDDLDGDNCWREMTLPENLDPRNLASVGRYWATDQDAAEAHWGEYAGYGSSLRKVILRARIDTGNIDKVGMMHARMNLSVGDEEQEVRFLKHVPIWVYDATFDDGKVVVEINGWRRT